MAEDGEQDDSQKTEDPTPKRLQEMREKGQVVMSREVNNWAILFAGTLILLLIGPWMFSKLTMVMRVYIASPHLIPADGIGLRDFVTGTMVEVGLYLLLPVLFLIVASIAAPFAQIGPLFSGESLKPKLEKISILQGFKRLFSVKSIIEFLKGLAKIIVVGFIVSIILWPFIKTSSVHIGQNVVYMMEMSRILTMKIMIGILSFLFFVAAIDYLYQRYEHLKKARMSRQEIKEEYKQTEGDPLIKGKLRQIRQERARQRIMTAVPKADVVITNPTHFAVALQYDPDKMNAPIMVAKGQDIIAQKIKEIAKEHKVPIMENKPLARALYAAMDINDEIPPEHYKAVADVISYVFKLKGKKVT